MESRLHALSLGKPCAGKPHARFDEGREVQTLPPTLPAPCWSSSVVLVLEDDSFEDEDRCAEDEDDFGIAIGLSPRPVIEVLASLVQVSKTVAIWNGCKVTRTCPWRTARRSGWRSTRLT